MQREYGPDETKRDQDELLERAPELTPEQTVENAVGGSSAFTDLGNKPPISNSAADVAEPTASDRAFGASGLDVAAAREWNDQHPEQVAEFNKLTGNTCADGTTVDPEKVRDWQLAHGLDADGKIGTATLGTARAAAATTLSEVANESPSDARRENAVAEDALAPAPIAEISAAAIVTETSTSEVADSYMEANELEDAVVWNDKHEEEVAAFNQATDNACVVHGKLDARKVFDWQDNHGITADGCVDTKTVLAAQDSHKAQSPEPAADLDAPTFA